MLFFKKIIDFYIFSNIHVALAGFCFTKITLFKFGITESLTPYFIALSIVVSYNFIRFFEIKTNRLHWFKSWFINYKNQLLVLSIVSILLLNYLVFFTDFNLQSIYILLPFAFMTFFYVVPFFKTKKTEFSFRNFPSIKIISIAISWAGITVFFPLYEAEFKFNATVYLEFVQRFLFLIAITIPFDIRDVHVDEKSLKTLPQIIGVNYSKMIGYILLLLMILLEFFIHKSVDYNSYILLVVGITAAIFLGFSSPKRTRFYTSFWVEGIPILWVGLIVLFS